MKLKSMKKVLAAVLSTTMVMGMSMTVLATDGVLTTPTTPTNPISGGGSITAPIFSYDVTNVVVPTSYGVAFNPDGLDVTISTTPTAATTSTVASKNYGIVNKSSKDKLVKVGLSVSSTEPTESVSFVNTAAEATDAEKGEYKIYLEVVPANGSAVQIYDADGNPETPTTSTQPSSLAHVQMTKATSTVPMKLGDNEVAFKLGKAEYSLKADGSLNLDGGINNDVKALYEVTDLDATAGVTGFTFDGAMNSKADWTKVTGKIEITPTYTIETTDDSVGVLDGTGAMTKVGPKVTASSTGLFTISGLSETYKFKSLTATYQGAATEMNSERGTWSPSTPTASSTGTVTFQLGNGWMTALAGQSTTVTLTYTEGGIDKTDTVTVKIQE